MVQHAYYLLALRHDYTSVRRSGQMGSVACVANEILRSASSLFAAERQRPGLGGEPKLHRAQRVQVRRLLAEARACASVGSIGAPDDTALNESDIDLHARAWHGNPTVRPLTVPDIRRRLLQM